jgi:hypothetical protein
MGNSWQESYKKMKNKVKATNDNRENKWSKTAGISIFCGLFKNALRGSDYVV